MPDCGVHYLWFAFVCFLIRSHPPPPSYQVKARPPGGCEGRVRRIKTPAVPAPRRTVQSGRAACRATRGVMRAVPRTGNNRIVCLRPEQSGCPGGGGGGGGYAAAVGTRPLISPLPLMSSNTPKHRKGGSKGGTAERIPPERRDGRPGHREPSNAGPTVAHRPHCLGPRPDDGGPDEPRRAISRSCPSGRCPAPSRALSMDWNTIVHCRRAESMF